MKILKKILLLTSSCLTIGNFDSLKEPENIKIEPLKYGKNYNVDYNEFPLGLSWFYNTDFWNQDNPFYGGVFDKPTQVAFGTCGSTKLTKRSGWWAWDYDYYIAPQYLYVIWKSNYILNAPIYNYKVNGAQTFQVAKGQTMSITSYEERTETKTNEYEVTAALETSYTLGTKISGGASYKSFNLSGEVSAQSTVKESISATIKNVHTSSYTKGQSVTTSFTSNATSYYRFQIRANFYNYYIKIYELNYYQTNSYKKNSGGYSNTYFEYAYAPGNTETNVFVREIKNTEVSGVYKYKPGTGQDLGKYVYDGQMLDNYIYL